MKEEEKKAESEDDQSFTDSDDSSE